MNCVEFERFLLEDEHSPEQDAHLNSCPMCADLLSDLNLISSQAKLLLATDEPSPAVWNALESRLRSEGLIRSADMPQRSLVLPMRDFFRRRRMAWLVPVAAVLALVAVVRLRRPADAGDNVAKQTAIQPAAKPPVVVAVSSDDKHLLDRVAARRPAQSARYSADLNDANAFIRDAESAAKMDPNDVYRQQMLINAYEQKEMLYDLAVDNVSEQ